MAGGRIDGWSREAGSDCPPRGGEGSWQVTASPILPHLRPQNVDVVLYYKASNPDAVNLPKEEKEKMEEKNGEKPEEEAWDELVCEPPAPIEMEPSDGEEGFEECQDQEGKEEDKQDEDNNPCPEASEENPLRISESRKVTAAKGWIVWETGPWAQMPLWSG